MTNQLFRDYLDGKIPAKPKPPHGIELLPWQVTFLKRFFGAADEFTTFAKPLIAAGIITLPLPTEPRARALAARQRRGHGPPSVDSWRGRERTTKYRSQK